VRGVSFVRGIVLKLQKQESSCAFTELQESCNPCTMSVNVFVGYHDGRRDHFDDVMREAYDRRKLTSIYCSNSFKRDIFSCFGWLV